jgi:pimeloyl-ACP methyl ester carboxylesterase
MKLAFKKYGQGEPLLILHGLYGMSDNWASIAKALAEKFTVYAIDARNHGHSPRDMKHDYRAMSNDLEDFMAQQALSKATLLGHSMGGKTVSRFAMEHPEKVYALVVVDISPGAYENTSAAYPHVEMHRNILQSLRNLDLNRLESRKEADKQLAGKIKEKAVRQFLLKNLHRDKDGAYSWKLNLDALSRNLPNILDGIPAREAEKMGGITAFPVLFIKGEKSSYITREHEKIIYQLFPEAKIKTIPSAGHWVHAEQPGLFLEKVTGFLKQE